MQEVSGSIPLGSTISQKFRCSQRNTALKCEVAFLIIPLGYEQGVLQSLFQVTPKTNMYLEAPKSKENGLESLLHPDIH